MSYTIVTTAASITQLVSEVPNVAADSIVNAVLGNKDIPRSYIADTRYGLNHLVGNKFYNYGKGSYINGLPTSKFTQEFPDEVQDLILAAINTEVTVPADAIVSMSLTTPKEQFLMYDFFARSPDWTIGSTNILGRYIDPFTVVEDSTGFEYKLGFLPLDNFGSFSKGNYHFELVPSSINPNLPNRVFDVPFNLVETTLVLNIIYGIGTPNFAGHYPENSYWVYAPNSNVHKELTYLGSSPISNNFYPIVPIRIDNLNVVDNVDKPELADSVSELLRRLNINLKDFSDSLTDPEDPTNLDSTDNAFLLFAANLDSDEDIIKHYLYEFFKSLYPIQNRDQQEWITHDGQIGPDLSGSPGSRNALYIQDQGQDIRIWFNFITVEVKNGNIDDTHVAYDSSILIPYTASIDTANAGIGDISKTIVLGTEYAGTFGTTPYYYNTHVTIFRKQLTTGPGATFVELVVHGLQHDILVDARAGLIHRSPADMDDGGFFIPLSKDIVELFNGEDESYIYYDSLIFLAYAIDVTKLKWYQDPAFHQFIQFIGIVFMLNSAGFSDAMAKGLVAFLEYIAEAYLTGLLLTEALAIVVNLIGVENAAVLAAIAATVAIASGSDSTQIFDLISAEKLLKAATLTIAAANKVVQDDFIELKEEAQDYEDEMREAYEDLDRVTDLLTDPVNLELYTILVPESYTDYTESSSDYYNRTIHQTNPGVLSLDVIENYVNTALTLPKPLSS